LVFKRLISLTAVTVLSWQVLRPTCVNAFDFETRPTGTFQSEITRDPVSGIVTSEKITPVNALHLVATPEQIESTGKLLVTLIVFVDALNPLSAVPGNFVNYEDNSDTFDIQVVPLQQSGTNALELTPKVPVDKPGTFGDIDFSFNVDPQAFGQSILASSVFTGSITSESHFSNVQPVPEPLTILGSFAAMGFGAYAERKRKPSKSSAKDNTKDS